MREGKIAIYSSHNLVPLPDNSSFGTIYKYSVDGLTYIKTSNGISTVVGDGFGFQITNITYSALKALYDGGTMTAGYYRITNFATIYEQPDFDAAGVPKVVLVTKTAITQPIIVLALSSTILSSAAYQEAYPKDKIQYDITFNVTERGNPAKGRISERIDEFNVRTDLDHRKILLKGYESAPGSGIFSVVNDNGGAFVENLAMFPSLRFDIFIGDFARISQLSFGAGYPIVSNNVIGTSNAIGIKLGILSGNNRLLSSTVGSLDFTNTFFGNTSLGANFSGNSGGWEFIGNEFAGECMRNTFGNNFGWLGGNIADQMHDNIFEGDNSNHIMVGNYQKNRMATHIDGIDFTLATLVSQDFTKDIVKSPDQTAFLSYIDNAGVQQIVSPTT